MGQRASDVTQVSLNQWIRPTVFTRYQRTPVSLRVQDAHKMKIAAALSAIEGEDFSVADLDPGDVSSALKVKIAKAPWRNSQYPQHSLFPSQLPIPFWFLILHLMKVQ